MDLIAQTAYIKGKPRTLGITHVPNYEEGLKLLWNTLLSLGGTRINYPAYEEDLVNILTRGQVWEADRRKFMKGQMSQCHRNASYCWDANRDISTIMTGYALIEGTWVQHSWVIQIRPRKNLLIETTYSFDRYFGFAMTPEECDQFFFDNM